jgi:hypothetical protein
MGIADSAKSGAGAAGSAILRVLGRIGALITFPVAVTLALLGQFILAALLVIANPAAEGASGDTGGATTLQVLLFILQGSALVYAVARGPAGPGRVYLALAALLWAIGSMLLMYVTLQCGVGGVCL